jgi:hypothetical protein
MEYCSKIYQIDLYPPQDKSTTLKIGLKGGLSQQPEFTLPELWAELRCMCYSDNYFKVFLMLQTSFQRETSKRS